jgi:hypothetical protein
MWALNLCESLPQILRPIRREVYTLFKIVALFSTKEIQRIILTFYLVASNAYITMGQISGVCCDLGGFYL